MLYYFFEFLEKNYQIPGASLFTYISFRTAAATILSLLISTIFGKKIIKFLKHKQIGESIRNLGLSGQSKKKRNTYHGRTHYYPGYVNSCFAFF